MTVTVTGQTGPLILKWRNEKQRPSRSVESEMALVIDCRNERGKNQFVVAAAAVRGVLGEQRVRHLPAHT